MQILTQQTWVGPGLISDKLSDEASAAGLGPQQVVGSKVVLNCFIILASAALGLFFEPSSDGCKVEFSRAL